MSKWTNDDSERVMAAPEKFVPEDWGLLSELQKAATRRRLAETKQILQRVGGPSPYPNGGTR